MVSQATEIRDFIELHWDELDNLSDRLSKVPLDNMKEIVRFFDREQVEGNEWSKAVVVRKINDEEKEDKTIYPNYQELTDKYDITLYYRVVDVQEPSYSEALEDVESMATELQRIIDLKYNPATGTGQWFTTNYFWFAHDHLDSNQPDLQRTVRLRLALLRGNDDKVYNGFDGVLVFDKDDSVGDSLPAADYTYQAVTRVELTEAYPQIPYLTKDIRLGRGVPQLGRGVFEGTFSAITYAHRDNMEGTTVDKFPNIYLPQDNAPLIGQQATAVFLHSNPNNESPPNVMTTKSFVKINSYVKLSEDVEVLKWSIKGQLIKPSEVSFS